ncbi:MAG: hypothetical protein ABSH34_35000 [Verrucomicrobiota bacterium]
MGAPNSGNLTRFCRRTRNPAKWGGAEEEKDGQTDFYAGTE